MSREIRRVPADFDWPINEVWKGYLRPDSLDEDSCPDCKNGYSPHAQRLHDLWYGHLPFDPAITGSAPFAPDTPTVRKLAERNVAEASYFYGTGEPAIVREAERLAGLFNASWSHHLTQSDVDALVDAGRLRSFTHTWSKETGLQPNDPPTRPTAAAVNEWSLAGFGHDSINAMVAVEARCKRDGKDDTCATCKGHGSLEAYVGQRLDAEAWEATEPPTGEGWQLWETVSEGSPISPVFNEREDMIGYLMSDANSWGISQPLNRTEAEAFVEAGSSIGSMVVVGGQMVPGDAAVLALSNDSGEEPE